MKRSLVFGSILGIFLTLIAAYFLLNSASLKPSGRAGIAEVLEDSEIPLVRVFDYYGFELSGLEDTMAHRAKIQPFSTTEVWDKAVATAKLPTNMRFTSGCEVVAPSRAIFVPPNYSDAVLASKINIHVDNLDMPNCFGTNWKVLIVEEDFVEGKTLFKVIAEATVDRVLEFLIYPSALSFFDALKLRRVDIPYLSNMNYGPVTSFGTYSFVHYNVSAAKPVVDPNVVPGFAPGAVTVKPAALKKLFQLHPRLGKPVFVDARDRAHASAPFAGAISVPFIPSNPIQQRFQLDFPVSLVAGAKIDMRALPAYRETALVVFGSDASDASPLWVIRAMRQQNYHRIFYVEGGFKEMQKVEAQLKF